MNLNLDDDFVEALRRISNGECRVRSRIIKEGGHAYSLSGEELEEYERYENNLLEKIKRLEKENEKLKAEIENLMKG